ncbi:MAG: hypothetical protein M1827_006507 [Pycnora praestabilis]|nr:MAG: hypothetical protein M1827_006507 [Pycnora praestabilis]
MQNDDAMAIDTEDQMPTNHNRQEGVAEDAAIEPVPLGISEESRGKEREADWGSNEGEELLPDGRPSLDRLHADVGPLYLLCKSAHPKSRPHPTQNLLSLYGLDRLAGEVARTDPVTGAKINKMRKSYEGKVKNFGVAGKNKPIKHVEGQPGGLMEMVSWPDEEWYNQKVAGREIEKGFDETLLAKLEHATKMEPGPLPNADYWKEVLGLDEEKKPPPASETASKRPVAQAAKVTQVNGATPRAAVIVESASGDPARPKRSGRKRRYDEHSFEGYGEGFVDDDLEMAGGGYSTGEGEENRRGSASKKKRRKDSGGAHPPHFGDRTASYSGQMVGMSSGIGAYGR